MARPGEEIAEVSGSLGQASFGAVEIQMRPSPESKTSTDRMWISNDAQIKEWPGSVPSWTGEVSLSSLGYFIPSPLISTNANN